MKQFVVAGLFIACGCGSTSGNGPDSGLSPDAGASGDSGTAGATTVFRIVTVAGGPLEAVAGDALALTVVVALSDGSTQPLPTDATITWTSPATFTAFSPYSTQQVPLWTFGPDPTAYFIDNPGRPDRSPDLFGVLFVLDPGSGSGISINLSARIGGIAAGGVATATLILGPTPIGNASRGASTYGASCSVCHGLTGAGTPPDPDGGYLMQGHGYAYPAPGLNADIGNLADDRSWNAALLSMAARADIDNEGLTLRDPMPDWLNPPPADGTALTTQELADVYAYLQTQQ